VTPGSPARSGLVHGHHVAAAKNEAWEREARVQRLLTEGRVQKRRIAELETALRELTPDAVWELSNEGWISEEAGARIRALLSPVPEGKKP
jgi:hypothetical protein